jgi:hypothetical protein
MWPRFHILLLACAASCIQAQVASYTTGVYSENFNSMGDSGTSTPNGWFVGISSAADGRILTVNNGFTGPSMSITGFNLGMTFATDRALGTGPTGSDRNMEVRIRNDSGAAIPAFSLRYTGEEWRTGNVSSNTWLELLYSTNGVSFVPMGAAFRFTSPRISPTLTPLDGNQPQNRTTNIGGTYAPAAPIEAGQVIHLRWFDFNDAAGTDPILALDDFQFEAVPPPVTIITNGPHSTMQVEGTFAMLGASVTGAAPLYFQWFKDNAPVGGATNQSHSIVPLRLSDAGNYFLVVSNSIGVVTSMVATVTVSPDVTPPQIVRAIALAAADRVMLSFSEPLAPADAELQENYDLFAACTGEHLAILGVVVTNETNVVLTTEARGPKNYFLSLANISDRAATANFIVPNPTTVRLKREIELIGSAGTHFWRYDESATDRTAENWQAPNYDDSAWNVALATFTQITGEALPANYVNTNGATPSPILTPPDVSGANTIYFRTHFTLPNTNLSLRLYAVVDDGAVYYVNGREVARTRISSGQAVNFSTSAGNAPEPPHVESGPFTIAITNLLVGDNVLAVEVHQVTSASGDIVMGARLVALFDEDLASPSTLRIERAPSGQLTLRWHPSHQLQETSALEDAGTVWVPATQSNGVPFNATGARFYRLELDCE